MEKGRGTGITSFNLTSNGANTCLDLITIHMLISLSFEVSPLLKHGILLGGEEIMFCDLKS